MQTASRRLTSLVMVVILLIANGCAAVSLFDQNHTHHHHYDGERSDFAERLESIERRLAKFDQPGRTEIMHSSHESSE